MSMTEKDLEKGTSEPVKESGESSSLSGEKDEVPNSSVHEDEEDEEEEEEEEEKEDDVVDPTIAVRSSGGKCSTHKDHNGKPSLPAKGQAPNSSADLIKPDGSIKQRRYFDKNGDAIEDIDYEHTDDGTHTFPHRHIWDWSKKPPRQDSR